MNTESEDISNKSNISQFNFYKEEEDFIKKDKINKIRLQKNNNSLKNPFSEEISDFVVNLPKKKKMELNIEEDDFKNENFKSVSIYKKEIKKKEFYLKNTKNQEKIIFNNLVENFTEKSEKKNSIKLFFPFKPYSVQKNYMRTILKTLVNEKNAILESPTGTGKTLSLLTSSLAFLKEKNKNLIFEDNNFHSPEKIFKENKKIKIYEKNYEENKKIKILYFSKTHFQIEQAIKELEKTVYRPKMMILSGRDKSCTNPELNSLNGNIKILKCLDLIKKKKCEFYNNFKQGKDLGIEEDIFNLEDVVKKGYEKKICGYHYFKNYNNFDIIFLPFFYALDFKFREKNKDLIKNSILIFDEAHNILDSAEKGANFSISLKNLHFFKLNLKTYIKYLKKYKEKDDIIKIKSLLAFFRNFERKLKRDCKKKDISNILEKGEYLLNLLKKCDTKRTNKIYHNNEIIDILKKIKKNSNKINKKYFLKPHQKTNLIKITDFFSFIKILYKNYLETKKKKNSYISNFRINLKKEKETIFINLICMSPSFTFKRIQDLNPLSIIITSGTLSPIKNFIKEININFFYKLKNNHVVDIKKNVFSTIITHLENNIKLDMTYKNRKNNDLIFEIGKNILKISKIVPEGLLVFFTSYEIMNFYINFWKEKKIFSRLKKLKKIFIETENSFTSNSILKNYIKVHKQGAIYFAICKGKLSEGMDFIDSMARCVIMIGLPLSNYTDPKIKAKMQYLEDLKKSSCTADKILYDSKEWYYSCAMRACNQAFGRVIRHKYDFGAVILFGMRYHCDFVKKFLSHWVKENVVTFDNEGYLKKLKEFFMRFKNELCLPKRNGGYDESDIVISSIDNKNYNKNYNESEIEINNESEIEINNESEIEINNGSEIEINNGSEICFSRNENDISICSLKNDNDSVILISSTENKIINESEILISSTENKIINESEILISSTENKNKNEMIFSPKKKNESENSISFFNEDNKDQFIKNKTIKKDLNSDQNSEIQMIEKSHEKFKKKDLYIQKIISVDSEIIEIKKNKKNPKNKKKNLFFNKKKKNEKKKDGFFGKFKDYRQNKIIKQETNFNILKKFKCKKKIKKTKPKKMAQFCAICYEQKEIIFSSKCGHLACEKCWEEYIKKKQECFMCRKKIKKKENLFRIFFNLDFDL